MLEQHASSFPIGDLYFDCGGVRIGFEICEDAWVANRPGADLARRSVDLLLNPSASHFAFGKIDVRKRFVTEGSRAFGVTYVYSNLLGNESGRAIFDGGALIATGGKLIAEGSRFSFADYEVTCATVDLDLNRMGQARTGSFTPNLLEDPDACVRCDFPFPALRPAANTTGRVSWETSASIKEEEFTRAVVLGLFDYLRKSRSGGFVVSLSGGADSAAVTVLASFVIQIGLKQLGRDGFLAKLQYLKQLHQLPDSEWIGALVTTVYQGTINSSDTTRNAARDVAAALGVKHLEWNVDQLVDEYTRMISECIGRQLSWETDDVPLQNIQARVRAPGVWFLANLRNALLLATSNRSEAAVGYATMDGDTCGGLSPIAGIDKAFLRQWLRWMEIHGPEGFGPIPALSAINVQAPTAELRPRDSGQTTRTISCPTRCWTRLNALPFAISKSRWMPICSCETGFPSTHASNWLPGSNASSPCGAAISGSASDTRLRFTLMMRTSIRKPGAVFRFSQADSIGNYAN
jgi:NAD+ synthase (glutamine-hydrolysing)